MNTVTQQNSETGKTSFQCTNPQHLLFSGVFFLLPAAHTRGLSHPNCCLHHFYASTVFTPFQLPHLEKNNSKEGLGEASCYPLKILIPITSFDEQRYNNAPGERNLSHPFQVNVHLTVVFLLSNYKEYSPAPW